MERTIRAELPLQPPPLPGRCPGCFAREEHCFCEAVSSLPSQNSTEHWVSLVIHARELNRTSNTGRWVHRCLPRSDVFVFGGKNVTPDWNRLLRSDHQPLLLFPGAARTLSHQDIEGAPLQLIVPDGNWRQAAKMTRWLATHWEIPKVSLPPGAISTFQIRKDRHHEGGLATIEAIAHAFRVLGEPDVSSHLWTLFRQLVQSTLAARGLQDRFAESTSPAIFG